MCVFDKPVYTWYVCVYCGIVSKKQNDHYKNQACKSPNIHNGNNNGSSLKLPVAPRQSQYVGWCRAPALYRLLQQPSVCC